MMMTGTLLSRIVTEKRAIVWPLGIALVVNLFAYFLVVRPLGKRSAGASDRAAAAVIAKAAATRELDLARRLAAGKSEADEELRTFYQKVLPSDLNAARRMTYASLPALARKSGVRYDTRSTVIKPTTAASRLGHMEIDMRLRGDYSGLRAFVYELERAPEFVIIDDVSLTEASQDEALSLAIRLSTYYRLDANGS